jgi:hypothetical protein
VTKSRFTLFIITLLTFGVAAAQELEYRMEIGAGLGLASYQGDFNGNLLKNLQPAGFAVARYNINQRSSWKFELAIGKIKGSSSDVQTYYSEPDAQNVHFSNSLYDLGCRYEYNFWAYGTGESYKGSRRLTPYIAMGMGFTYVNGSNSAFAVNVPLGMGVKYKAMKRLNVGAEWTMHFSTSDKLDGVVDPYGIKSSGLFKNTDCYSIFQVFVTYDIMPKYRRCNN